MKRRTYEFNRNQTYKKMTKGNIYFDTKNTGFTQFRGHDINGNLIMSGVCDFYSDAKTTMIENIVSKSYSDNLVDPAPLNLFPYATFDSLTGGYRSIKNLPPLLIN